MDIIDDESIALGTDQSTNSINTGIDSNYALWILVLACILLLIILVSWIYSKMQKFRNDFYDLSSLITACTHIVNVSAYLLFLNYITYKFDLVDTVSLEALLIMACIFIVIPLCITLYQLHVQLKKWEKQSVEFGEWIARNASFLCFTSIITLSPYTAVKLCRSHLFNLRHFAMPLTKLQASKFQSQRLFTVILLQVCVIKYEQNVHL